MKHTHDASSKIPIRDVGETVIERYKYCCSTVPALYNKHIKAVYEHKKTPYVHRRVHKFF